MEWTTISAPRLSGRWQYGLAKVLSTNSQAPDLWTSSATAARSTSCIVGLIGDSAYTRDASGWFSRAACHPDSDKSSTHTSRIPRVRGDIMQEIEGMPIQCRLSNHGIPGPYPAEHSRGNRRHAGRQDPAGNHFIRRAGRIIPQQLQPFQECNLLCQLPGVWVGDPGIVIARPPAPG